MNRTAEKYAVGLYDAAIALDCADAVADELGGMADVITQCAQSLRGSPVAGSVLSGLLREVLTGKVQPLTLEFVLLLQTRRHLKHFAAAALHFRELCGKERPVVRLRVSHAPDDQTLRLLEERLAKEQFIPGDAVDDIAFDVKVDAGLLGGFVADCGGYQLDTSLKTALEKMKRA